MKNFLKTRIFAFILGALIFSGITIASAYSLFASQIGYSPDWKASDGFDITNVEQAMNELYTIGNKTLSFSTNGWTTYGGTGYVQNNGHAENIISNLTSNEKYLIQVLGGMEVTSNTNNITFSFEGGTCSQINVKTDYGGTKLQNNNYLEWYTALYNCTATAQSIKVIANNNNNYWMWFYSSAYKIFQ